MGNENYKEYMDDINLFQLQIDQTNNNLNYQA